MVVYSDSELNNILTTYSFNGNVGGIMLGRCVQVSEEKV